MLGIQWFPFELPPVSEARRIRCPAAPESLSCRLFQPGIRRVE